MSVPYRFAICNEVFTNTAFGDVCRRVRALGYDGLELAPHTLAEDATRLRPSERAEIRASIERVRLEFVGLHWLLVSPPGLHATSNDPDVRRRTWDYVARATQLCADLAGSRTQWRPVIVLGSPKQRSTNGAMTPPDAVSVLTEELGRLAPQAEDLGVTLLVEAIPKSDTDVVNTLADAVDIVQRIGRPGVQTMFDVHNAADECEEHVELVRRYLPYIRHVHTNEPDGREPGSGSYDFASLLTALNEAGYPGWVSVEAFDFSRPAEEIARRALDTLTAARPAVAR